MRKKKDLWICRDCGSTDFDLFMVRDDVWLLIWPTYIKDMAAIRNPKKRHGVLCQECAERRLGRKLTQEDQELNGADWIDPAGVSESFREKLEINSFIEEKLEKVPEKARKQALDRYFLVDRSPLRAEDWANARLMLAADIDAETVAIMLHCPVEQLLKKVGA